MLYYKYIFHLIWALNLTTRVEHLNSTKHGNIASNTIHRLCQNCPKLLQTCLCSNKSEVNGFRLEECEFLTTQLILKFLRNLYLLFEIITSGNFDPFTPLIHPNLLFLSLFLYDENAIIFIFEIRLLSLLYRYELIF